jgi:hypothetical protein
MVRNTPKHEFWVQWNGLGASVAKNSDAILFSELCVNATSLASLHWHSCSNETVRNNPKHEFWVQWSGSHAFVAKNFEPNSFSELVRYWHLFSQFCINFPTVMKRSEMTQNMSFGSNGVDRVHSLRKIPTRLCLLNLCDNGTSSSRFASTFVQYQNGPKRPKTWLLGPMEWIGCVRCEKFWRDLV